MRMRDDGGFWNLVEEERRELEREGKGIGTKRNGQESSRDEI